VKRQFPKKKARKSEKEWKGISLSDVVRDNSSGNALSKVLIFTSTYFF
jgi:hypothetical protein